MFEGSLVESRGAGCVQDAAVVGSGIAGVAVRYGGSADCSADDEATDDGRECGSAKNHGSES